MSTGPVSKQQNATKGRVVFTLAGKEVKEGTPDSKARINGPHLESKWAQHLLGTYETPSERKHRIKLERLRQYEIAVSETLLKPKLKPKFKVLIAAPR